MEGQNGARSDSPSQAISRGMVAIYKDYIGRGPTNTQTTIQGDVVTSICRDSLTKAEVSLVASGDAETVRSIRRKFQFAMSADIRELVGGTTGRKTVTMLSDHDVENDIAVEMVILDGDTPGRG